MIQSALLVGAGAACGAIIRWLLGLGLNAVFPLIPLGTLVANLSGSYLIGVGLGAFATLPSLAPELRLLLLTGFLGGLTTFSAFSAEMVTLLREGRLLWAGCGIALHVAGSLLMTFLGLGTFYILARLHA